MPRTLYCHRLRTGGISSVCGVTAARLLARCNVAAYRATYAALVDSAPVHT
jgi:hypothetical protein